MALSVYHDGSTYCVANSADEAKALHCEEIGEDCESEFFPLSGDKPTLANELSDSTELLAYARRLLAVERPRMCTAAGQVRMNELLQRIAEVFPAERAAE